MIAIQGESKGFSRKAVQNKQPAKLPALAPKESAQKAAGSKNTDRNNPSRDKGKQPKEATKKQTTATSTVKLTPSVAVTKSVIEIAKERLVLPAGHTGSTGSVKVKFNHYNKSFPLHNGVVKWSDIDEEYAISFVYRGNFGRNLQIVSDAGEHQYATSDDGNNYFIDLVDKAELRLEVTEDPHAGIGAEGLRLNNGPLKATELATQASAVKSTTRAMDTITAELKTMAPTDLNNAHAKDLLERRDLEDLLYSG
jgi:hypothetical protein